MENKVNENGKTTCFFALIIVRIDLIKKTGVTRRFFRMKELEVYRLTDIQAK